MPKTYYQIKTAYAVLEARTFASAKRVAKREVTSGDAVRKATIVRMVETGRGTVRPDGPTHFCRGEGRKMVCSTKRQARGRKLHW
jgi:hypothetical protein